MKRIQSTLCAAALIGSHSLSAAEPLYSSIDCGLTDVTPIEKQADLASGTDYQTAIRQVIDHMFIPAPKESYDFSILLSYLNVMYEDNLGVSLSERELDLMLCTMLSRSEVERELDFDAVGLGHFNSKEHYVFHGRLTIEPGYVSHLWYLVEAASGNAHLIAIDD